MSANRHRFLAGCTVLPTNSHGTLETVHHLGMRLIYLSVYPERGRPLRSPGGFIPLDLTRDSPQGLAALTPPPPSCGPSSPISGEFHTTGSNRLHRSTETQALQLLARKAKPRAGHLGSKIGCGECWGSTHLAAPSGTAWSQPAGHMEHKARSCIQATL